MLMQTVLKKCGLTKKAVLYYTEQGLIRPTILENGYRDFSDEDIEKLKKIAVLRGFGLSVPEIQTVLENPDSGALSEIALRQGMAIEEQQERHRLLTALTQENDWMDAWRKLAAHEDKQSILRRLTDQFPGYYGKYLSLHFAPFLNEPIKTDDQREAFKTILTFLDGVHFELPEDLKKVLDEAAKSISDNMPVLHENIAALISDTEIYLEENKELLTASLKFTQSESYKNTPAYRLKTLLSNRRTGYDTVFIPAMKRLSSAYADYHEGLIKANKLFMTKFNEIIK